MASLQGLKEGWWHPKNGLSESGLGPAWAAEIQLTAGCSHCICASCSLSEQRQRLPLTKLHVCAIYGWEPQLWSLHVHLLVQLSAACSSVRMQRWAALSGRMQAWLMMITRKVGRYSPEPVFCEWKEDTMLHWGTTRLKPKAAESVSIQRAVGNRSNRCSQIKPTGPGADSHSCICQEWIV